jgi:hypothetical protein
MFFAIHLFLCWIPFAPLERPILWIACSTGIRFWTRPRIQLVPNPQGADSVPGLSIVAECAFVKGIYP